jgi:alpha-mannosidase
MTQTLHVISHTHWDREWYLTFQQFRLKLVHLIDGLLDTLDNDPGFKYFMLDGQTIVLDDYLSMRPEKEPILRQHVQNGRILIGPWHLLPDMYLVSPEAHIRNLLQGRRTASRFGALMPVGYIPDPFGHPGQVPQILCGFGFRTAALWRGVGDSPCEFWWQSPDGSRVLMAYLCDSYSNGASLPAGDHAAFTAQLAQTRDQLSAHSAARDYLVMYGTDHMEPSPLTAAAISYANQHLPGTRVLHSTLPAYIEAISAQVKEQELPVVAGELRDCSRTFLLPGVLSTRMGIKQRNAACETLLEKWVEPFSTFASLVGGVASERLGNTAPLIRQAWRLLMENHPHDSICGCSIDQVADEMRVRFDQVEQIGEELTRQSLHSLAAQVDTRFPGALAAVLVFNPTGSLRSDLVEVELSIPEDIPAFELVGSDGSAVPYELVGSAAGEFANIVLDKKGLRETFATIHEGRVAGVSIVKITVGQPAPTVNIDAVVSSHEPPDLAVFRQAEQMLAALEAAPSVTHFHVRARMTRSSRLRFVTPEIPAHGWGLAWVRPADAPAAAEPASLSPLLRPLLPLALRIANSTLGSRILARLVPADEHKPPFLIENELLRAEASAQDGTLTLTDKRSGAVYTGLNRFVDGADAGDEYNYSPPEQDSLITAQLISLKVLRSKVVPSLEISYRLRLPARLSADRKSRAAELVEIPITSRVSLAQGAARLELHTELENLAGDHRLRVHFPVPFSVTEADYDGHFEVVRRPLGVPEMGEGWVEDPRPETHQRHFTDVSNGQHGLMLANRGLPEVEVIPTPTGAEFALTLLRCVGWLSRDDLSTRRGHAGPATETPGAQMPGKWAFDYALIPHAGTWQAAYPQAYAFAAPLWAISDFLHAGRLPASGSFIAHSPPEFVISAVKEAEMGQGWIVRGYNITGSPLDVTLCPIVRARFVGAGSVRTCFKPAPTAPTAALANLAEEPLTPLDMDEDGAVHFTANAHQVVTVRFW